MNTLLKKIAIIFNFGFFFLEVASGVEKAGIADDPSKANTAFIVGLSLKPRVRIVERIKISKKLSWRDVEKKTEEVSGLYEEALVNSGKDARLLVCIFEYKDEGVIMTIYQHYIIHGDEIFLPHDKRLMISELYKTK